ncbi:MAG: GTPase Era, partial [Gammaproteobacteria bacterium]
MMDKPGRFGYVTIIGRPNVGKSTLLNRIIGQKLSIISRKPQTTRTRILGIKTTDNCQTVYIDTPGLQKKPVSMFNRYMNREALSSLADVDVIIHVVDAVTWTESDEHVQQLVKQANAPALLAVNKVDRIKNKKIILPYIKMVHAKGGYQEIIPVSARANLNVDQLEECIVSRLPAGPAHFPDDQITDRSERYFACEFLREKLIQRLGDELPYNLCVTIEEFRDTPALIRIDAVIWVEKGGQKKIVIGGDGSVLKKTGEQARLDMEKLFGKKVLLRT